MQKLAIDASTAATWQLSEEPEADRAREMLRDYVAERIAFIAPKIWHYEIANIINKAISTRRLSAGEGQQAFEVDIEFIDWPSPAEAYRLARTYRRSVYDSFYVAVAQIHGVELWTGDRRLYNAVKNQLSFVKWIGGYASSRRQ